MVEFQNKIKEIQEKVKSNGIVINRVPNKTKEDFIAIANEEFEGDYGMLLKTMADAFFELRYLKLTFFENLNYKLNNILEIVSQTEQKEKPEKKKLNLLSGRQIEVKGGNKNE